VDATVLGHHFPDALTTKLLEASLTAGRMNPELIVDTLGVEAISKHAPTRVVWECLAKVGTPGADAKPAAGAGAGVASEKAPAPLPIPAPPPEAAQGASAAPANGQAANGQANGPGKGAQPGAATAAGAIASGRHALEFLEDDAPSVLVEIDEPQMTVEVSEAPVVEEKKKPQVTNARVVKRA
jgi:hypothetical protein